MASLSNIAGSALALEVRTITVESTATPPFVITDPFGPSPVAHSSKVDAQGNPSATDEASLTLLKPKVTIETKDFGNVTIAPYGDPGPGYWPEVKAAGVIAGVSVAGLLMFAMAKALGSK